MITINAKEQEIQHLNTTLVNIEQEKNILSRKLQELNGHFQSDLKELADIKIQTGSEEAFYESVVEYQKHEQDLMMKYQNAQSQEKRIQTLSAMQKSPYFARIDFKEEALDETLYLGIASLRDKNEEPTIIDWRAPIANLYYEGHLGKASYQTDHDTFEVELTLKRQFKITDGKLQAMVDTNDTINDEFLLEVLDEASSNQMKNIVATIQKMQNTIIRDSHSKAVLIQGIAGSGKTSALLQRVAYILYHNRQWLDEKQVLVFSPNRLFTDYISMVLPSLGESQVPTFTFNDFLQQLLPTMEIPKNTMSEEEFLADLENAVDSFKQSVTAVYQIKPYLKSITAVGPLFRNLKLNDRMLLSKEQIRAYYLETNPNLPIHQRMQLLQTRLLKKIGGLMKDEAKLPEVKALAEEMLQQAFEDNPNLEADEKTERKMLKEFRQQIVKKKFRKIKRAVKNYTFINLAAQYLHFLKTIATVSGIDIAEYQTHLVEVKNRLRNRQLTTSDATLYFLLAKGLYPIYVEQKGRFIFIDEMQDFPPAQVALLRSLYPKANISLCGDLNQKIFGNDSIVGSLNRLFPDVEVTNYQLTTSYRSTQEITDFANQFLSQEDQVVATARHASLPTLWTLDKNEKITWFNQFIQQCSAEQPHLRTAIICKTTHECQELYQQLDEKLKATVQLLDSEETFMKRDIMIIPAYLAKGLEFDRVIAWDVNQQFHTSHDQLILYTIFTRAMHELHIVSEKGQLSPYLLDLNPESFQTN